MSALLIGVLLRFPRLLVDRPNERSLHEKPTPRTGGLAIVLGSLAAWVSMIHSSHVLGLAVVAIAIVSLFDDWRGLHPLPRLSAHIAVAAIFTYIGLGRPPLAEFIFLVLAIVWVTNLYNFMDGADGLAAGMTIAGFGFYAVAAWSAEQLPLALICASIAAATTPFLAANFHPARLFMGDTGSITLGFLAGAIGAIGWREGAWSPFFPVFVFSPFIADASLTLLHRSLNRQPFWRPHRSHYYQKLIQMGVGHRKTTLAEYGLMLIAGCCGLMVLTLDYKYQLGAIIVWGIVLIALAEWIDHRWKLHQPDKPS